MLQDDRPILDQFRADREQRSSVLVDNKLNLGMLMAAVRLAHDKPVSLDRRLREAWIYNHGFVLGKLH